jgi:glycosyltransferase involved in cell wall biosynthesis
MINQKIKVRFLGGTHAIYQEIVNYPPENVEYVGVQKSTKQGKYYQSKKVNTKLSKIFQALHLPRMIYLPFIKEDLIHSSRGILILNAKPWVMDIEHPASFSGMNLPLLKKSKFLKSIVKKKMESLYCKKIMFHCNASLEVMERLFDCSKIRNKMEVLHPATHLIKLKQKKKKNKIIILSVLSLFKEKGGVQALEAFKRLENKFNNVEFWLKSDVPDEYKQKYNSKNIKYFPYREEILTREELLNKYYSQADIFLYPTFADTFGYSLLDSMLAKLPVVSSNNFAIGEIVENGKNGFTIHNKLSYAEKEYDNECLIIQEDFVRNLVEKLSILIKDSKLRRKMGAYGYSLVSQGKFSIKYRNAQLRKIYSEALI